MECDRPQVVALRLEIALLMTRASVTKDWDKYTFFGGLFCSCCLEPKGEKFESVSILDNVK